MFHEEDVAVGKRLFLLREILILGPSKDHVLALLDDQLLSLSYFLLGCLPPSA